ERDRQRRQAPGLHAAEEVGRAPAQARAHPERNSEVQGRPERTPGRGECSRPGRGSTAKRTAARSTTSRASMSQISAMDRSRLHVLVPAAGSQYSELSVQHSVLHYTEPVDQFIDTDRGVDKCRRRTTSTPRWGATCADTAPGWPGPWTTSPPGRVSARGCCPRSSRRGPTRASPPSVGWP